MDSLTGPGLAQLPPRAPGGGPPPDPTAEPEGFVVAADDGVRIHFLDWNGGGASAGVVAGGGAPAGVAAGAAGAEGTASRAPGVLLLHGLGSTGWSWTPVARRLRRDARVIAMDLRGHGLSDAPTDGYDPDTLAGDAIAVAEGAGLLVPSGEPAGGTLILAGIGYGAIVAAWTARALGDRCAGLVLVDGGWEDLATTTGSTAEEWLAAIEEPPEVLASMDAWLADRAAFDPASWDVDEVRAARAQVVETAAGRVKPAVHLHAMAGSIRAMWSFAPAAVLPTVEARIAALVARDEDGRRAAALAEVARAREGTGRSPVLAAAFPGRGHNLVRHEPAAVAAAVLAVVS